MHTSEGDVVKKLLIAGMVALPFAKAAAKKRHIVEHPVPGPIG
jgi:hypothetical protein